MTLGKYNQTRCIIGLYMDKDIITWLTLIIWSEQRDYECIHSPVMLSLCRLTIISNCKKLTHVHFKITCVQRRQPSFGIKPACITSAAETVLWERLSHLFSQCAFPCRHMVFDVHKSKSIRFSA